MADFNAALAITLSKEGGFDIRTDTFEVVNRGITLATYFGQEAQDSVKILIADMLQKGDFSKEALIAADPNVAFIFNLTPDQTAAFYRSHYWDLLKLDQVHDQQLAAKIFDLGVNMGVGTITRIVQEAVNALGHSVTVDGRIGVLTMAAINLCEPVLLLGEIRDLAAERYREIAAADPRHKNDLDGWLDRLKT